MFHPADGENSGASLGGSVMRNGITAGNSKCLGAKRWPSDRWHGQRTVPSPERSVASVGIQPHLAFHADHLALLRYSQCGYPEVPKPAPPLFLLHAALSAVRRTSCMFRPRRSGRSVLVPQWRGRLHEEEMKADL